MTDIELMDKCYRDAFSIVHVTKVSPDDTIKIATAIIAVKLFEVRMGSFSIKGHESGEDIIYTLVTQSKI